MVKEEESGEGRPDEAKKSCPGQVFGPMAKTNPPKHKHKDKREMVVSWEFEQSVVLLSQHQS